MSDTPLIVWLYGDVTCPWTYLALGRLRRLEQRLDGRFAVGWRPLPIDPAPPGSSAARQDRDVARGRRMGHEVDPESAPKPAEFEHMGLPYVRAPAPAIARDALQAVEFARDLSEHLARTVLDGLFRHGFAEGSRLDSREGLLAICEELGLDREGLTHALSDGRYDLELERAETEAQRYGIGSVPTILAGRSKLVGAAPEQLLETVIRSALDEESDPPT